MVALTDIMVDGGGGGEGGGWGATGYHSQIFEMHRQIRAAE